MNQPLIYLASPYSHKLKKVREQRFREIAKVSARLTVLGHFIFSPISMNHTWTIYCDPDTPLGTSWDYWKRYDERLLDVCDELWVCTMEGWKESKGIAAEIKYADACGMRIYYIDPITLRIKTK